ncbi:hypothetical protein BaRGS_00017969 [Batillaria attramentaria]|uniref:Uncharacterized protein n=1 Tax=Batillaria attramentaria TaxID=370345 RepID=A0ABD0KUA0_9CAEN
MLYYEWLIPQTKTDATPSRWLFWLKGRTYFSITPAVVFYTLLHLFCLTLQDRVKKFKCFQFIRRDLLVIRAPTLVPPTQSHCQTTLSTASILNRGMPASTVLLIPITPDWTC